MSLHIQESILASLVVHLYFFFLAVPRSLGNLSSLTRDPAQDPSGESSKFQPLDCQGIPECPLRVYTCHQGNSGHQFNFIEFPVNAFLFIPFFFSYKGFYPTAVLWST